MEFNDSFTVPVPPEVAWSALNDIERIAPCLPGAALESVEDGVFLGTVSLKLGPIRAEYNGTAHFEDVDPDARSLVVVASGRDKRGQGTASARVHVRVEQEGVLSRVSLDQQVDITGKAAQFGRGILKDVSKQMMDRFAVSLAQMLVAEAQTTGAEAMPSQSDAPIKSFPAAPSAVAASGAPISVVQVAAGLARQRPFHTLLAFGGLALICGLIVYLIREVV